MEKLTNSQILDAGLDDWRLLAQALHARFLTGDLVRGLAFVTAVTEAAERANHHPDVTLTYPWVDLRLISHVDPHGRVPLLWFQHTDAHDTPRQRFHIDLWVPHDLAEKRIAAAVAAGGRVVDDANAPSFVVLADPEGNRACVCTCLDR